MLLVLTRLLVGTRLLLWLKWKKFSSELPETEDEEKVEDVDVVGLEGGFSFINICREASEDKLGVSLDEKTFSFSFSSV